MQSCGRANDNDGDTIGNEDFNSSDADELIPKTIRPKAKKASTTNDPLKEDHPCKRLILIDVGSVNET